jgi:hypothetical protein
MARKSQSTTDNSVTYESEIQTKETKVKYPKNYADGPGLFQRNAFGLLSNVDYVFAEDGSVNWRSMIKDEHLFPNRSWFDLRKKDMPRTIDGLGDHQLLIKLSGIKELAKLRGFTDVAYEVVKCQPDHVAVICRMTFLPNYETGGKPVQFQDKLNCANFEEFKSVLRDWWKIEKYQNDNAKDWNSYSDISPTDARILMKLINS